MTERFNQSLLNMLGTLQEHEKADWKSFVSPLVHAYNATTHESTGFSPFYLMFGRNPRLAIDAFLGINPDMHENGDHSAYVRNLKSRLDFAYRTANREAKRAARRHKIRYDLKVRESRLQPGDRVLVKTLGLKGKHKLADKWEKDPYIVQSQPNPDIPVFVVKRENGRSKERTVHRNLLLPFMSLSTSDTHDTPQVRVPSKRQSEHLEKRTPAEYHVDSQSDSENDDAGIYIIPQRRGNNPVQLNPNARIFTPMSTSTLPNTSSASGYNSFSSGSVLSKSDSNLTSGVGLESVAKNSESSLPWPEEGEKSDVSVGTVPLEPVLQMNPTSISDSSNNTEFEIQNESVPQSQESLGTNQEIMPQYKRPVRQRRPPGWMTTGEWQLSALQIDPGTEIFV